MKPLLFGNLKDFEKPKPTFFGCEIEVQTATGITGHIKKERMFRSFCV